jgi:hypothetical protein
MENYMVLRIISRLRLIRYLLSKADVRGYTHGEKHHLLQVALGEVMNALGEMGSFESNYMQNADVTPPKIDDITF